MSHPVMFVAFLCGIALAYRTWVNFIVKESRRVDDVDKHLSKLHNERASQNLCIYCATPLERRVDSDRHIFHFICSKCAPEYPTAV